MVWDHVLWCDTMYPYGAVWYLVLRNCGRCHVLMWCPGAFVFDIAVGAWWCGVVLIVLWYDRASCCGSNRVSHNLVVVMQYDIMGVVWYFV